MTLSSRAIENGGAAFFQPDVMPSGKGDFVAELPVHMIEFDDLDVGPESMEEFVAPPSEEEIRRAVESELYEKMEAEVETLRRQDEIVFQELAFSLKDTLDVRLERIARRSVELAMAIAERIIRDRVEHDPEMVVRAVHDVLTRVESDTKATVTAHPDDAKLLRTHPDLLADLGIETVLEDPRQARGGALIDVDRAGWDVSIVTQLRSLQEEIERILEAS